MSQKRKPDAGVTWLQKRQKLLADAKNNIKQICDDLESSIGNQAHADTLPLTKDQQLKQTVQTITSFVQDSVTELTSVRLKSHLWKQFATELIENKTFENWLRHMTIIEYKKGYVRFKINNTILIAEETRCTLECDDDSDNNADEISFTICRDTGLGSKSIFSVEDETSLTGCDQDAWKQIAMEFGMPPITTKQSCTLSSFLHFLLCLVTHSSYDKFYDQHVDYAPEHGKLFMFTFFPEYQELRKQYIKKLFKEEYQQLLPDPIIEIVCDYE
jgi:hypothetical protein